MIETLNAFDVQLFHFFNGMHAEWLDVIMVILSSKVAWIPVYALIFGLLTKNYGWKAAVLAGLAVVPLIVLSDQISASFFKPFFERCRPCHVLENVHIVNRRCGGQYGFVSSHAANFFALATYLVFAFRFPKPLFVILFFVCAVLVAYSRIYLGVHYPGDVFFGGMLGILVGLFVGWGYKKWLIPLTEEEIA